MCWMNVGFKIWDIVATNSLSVMGMGRGIQCERDSIEQHHKPIMIHLLGIPKQVNKPWRFEQMWIRYEGCREVIEDAWVHVYQGSPMSRVEGKVERCCKNLKWWSKVAFGNVIRSLRRKKSS